MPSYPSPRHALFLAFLFIVCQVVLGSLVGLVSERLALVATELTLVLLLGLFLGLLRFSVEDVLLLNATHISAILASLIAAVGAALLAADFDLHFTEYVARVHSAMPASQQRYVIDLQLIDGMSEGLVVFATLVLAPALCEELFFRGFVFTALAARHGVMVAILGSSLLFAAVHFNPWQFPALFLLGVFLAILVYVTHSIYPAIIAHLVTNSLSVIGLNLRARTGQDLLAAADHLPLAVLLGAVVLLWTGLRILYRQRPIVPLLRPVRALPLP